MKKGFTIIELMIVIAIIAMLTAIIVPNVINFVNHDSSDDIVIMDKSEYVEETPDNKEVKSEPVTTDKYGSQESRY